MLSVEDARARMLADAVPLPAVHTKLIDADGCVLAADLAALRTQPPADVSAMDGYAVRAVDVASAPARLELVGEVAAGRPFDRVIGPGQAARIFTGGVLPTGADTVVIQEVATREADSVVVHKATATGRNVRATGLDFRQGDVLLRRGHHLTTRDLALCAAMNHPEVCVHRRPTVAVLATGDELVMPGQAPGREQIVYSNGFSLMALAQRQGAKIIDLGIVPDRLDDTIAAVRRARDAMVDVLVTTGGASVGDYDLVQRAFAAEGVALSFWRVALRPGRPLMHGRLGPMQVLGLPGNPVSAYVCAVLFLLPLIRRLAGRSELELPTESAILGGDLPANDERADYLRAQAREGADGRVIATALPIQDSSLLAPLATANCLLIRTPYAPAATTGSSCRIVRLES